MCDPVEKCEINEAEFSKEIGRIMEHLDTLHKFSGDLEDKLSVVLSPAMPQVEPRETPETPTKCELEGMLVRVHEHVEGLYATLNHIYNRIQL